MFNIRNLETGRERFSLRHSEARVCNHCSALSLGKIVESAKNKVKHIVMTYKISVF